MANAQPDHGQADPGLGDHGHGDVVVDHSHHTHVCSAATFFGIYAALLFFTFITVWIAQFDFGGANMLIAMGVASVKAALVMTVFMHLKWDTAVNNIAFLSSILFLSLLFLFTIADHATRGEAEATSGSVDTKFEPAKPLREFRGAQ